MSQQDATPETTVQKMMTDQEYVDAGGNLCPHCRSDDIEADGKLEADSDYAHRDVKCNDCDRRWMDAYRLVGWMPA